MLTDTEKRDLYLKTVSDIYSRIVAKRHIDIIKDHGENSKVLERYVDTVDSNAFENASGAADTLVSKVNKDFEELLDY